MGTIDMTKFPDTLQGQFWAFAYQKAANHNPSYRVYLGTKEYLVTDNIDELREIQSLIFVTRDQIDSLTIFFSNNSLRPINEAEKQNILV
jgi:hypothetical protein